MRLGRTSLAMLALAVGTTACGPAELTVTGEIQVEDAATGQTSMRPLGEMEIQLLPYDRDAIFDSLQAAYPEPEPPIPDSLLAAREQLQAAQEAWRQAENRWNTLRDSLATISEELEGLNRGEGRYRVLFNEFNDLEAEYTQVERQMNQAFDEFQSMQEGIITRSEEIRLLREDWADQAFAEVGEIIATRIREVGRDPVFDTTDASGTVTLQVPPGQWWVHARHELPYTELYWNIMIELVRGEPQTLILNRDNAEVRQAL